MRNDVKFPEYKLGERIKELREKRKQSQEDLAKATGLSQSTISQVEREEKDPSLTTLQKIAQGLDIHIAVLFLFYKLGVVSVILTSYLDDINTI